MSVVTTAPDPAMLGPALSGTVPAPVGRRIGALMIDSLLISAVSVAAELLVVLVSAASRRDAPPALMILVGLVQILAPIAVAVVQWRLHATTGQTLGKRAVGIRTLAVPTGGAPGWGRTLGRYLLYGLSSLICGIGQFIFALSVFWDSDRLLRAWHDKAASVYLIDIRNGRDPLAPGMVAATPATASQAYEATPAAAPVATGGQPVAALPAPIAAHATSQAAPAPLPVAAPPAATPAAPVGPSPVAPAWAAEPVPAVAAPPAGAASGAQPTPGAGIISSVPGLAAASRPVPPPPPPPPPAPAPADVRPPAPPVALPFSPFPAPQADDDADMTVMSLDPVAQVAQVRLVFDTGDVLAVTGRGRIGRNPVAGEEALSHLVPLADTTKSVSKTHLEFALGDGGLWVRDLHSTNGSSIERSGARTPLPADEWVRADPGAVVYLGSRTFRVDVS